MRTVVRSLAIVAIVLVVPLVVIGIIGPADGREGPISYRLEWVDAPGSSQVTDLGYEVTVERVSVTTYTVTLVACEHDHGVDAFSVASAFAGHSTDGDPALISGPWVEDLASGGVTTNATATASEPAYCEGHLVFGNASGPTLVIEGSFVAPGSSAPVALSVATDVDWGTKVDLVDTAGASVHVEAGDPIEVIVTRSIAGLFDGIDLSSVSAGDLEVEVLRSLAESVSFQVTAGAVH